MDLCMMSQVIVSLWWYQGRRNGFVIRDSMGVYPGKCWAVKLKVHTHREVEVRW